MKQLKSLVGTVLIVGSKNMLRKKNIIKKYIILKKCLTCNKEFEVYKKVVKEGNGKYCCRKCFEKRQISKKVRIKIRNTLRNGKYIKCKNCNEDFYVNQSGLKNGRKYCSTNCAILDSKNKKLTIRHRKILSITKLGNKNPMKRIEVKEKISGKNNWNWQGGKSFEPYGIEFNNYLKEQIRKRDSYRCQECFRHQDELFTKTGRKYKLNIHHIDYNKQNNSLTNLISLCRNCHMQTNFSRKNWTEYFNNKTNI